MGTRSISSSAATVFDTAVASLSGVRLRPEIRLAEIPAPSRIAPHSLALSAEVLAEHRSPADSQDEVEDAELASGRFVVLHDPSAPEPWQGTWRIVSFARAELEPETATDPLLGEVGWSWLTDCLRDADAPYTAAAGTVTRVVSESFGELVDRPATVEVEVRASWTPEGDLAAHLRGWADLLCTVAGLPPLPEGVTALPGQRR